SSFIGDLTSDALAPHGKPAPTRGQAAAGACEIALVTDRIRSKDGLREGLAQCTMGGKPAGVKSSSGAHAHLLPLARGNLGFARLNGVSPDHHLAAGTRTSIDR